MRHLLVRTQFRGVQVRPPADEPYDQHVRIVPVSRTGELFVTILAETDPRLVHLGQIEAIEPDGIFGGLCLLQSRGAALVRGRYRCSTKRRPRQPEGYDNGSRTSCWSSFRVP